MNAFDRLRTAVAGGTPDRIPVSVWFHFGSEHLAPEAVARLHADFHRTYRWDFLKVMFDYRLDIPAAVDAGAAINLDALLAETDWEEPFARQRDCLALLQEDLGGEVPIVETVYSPWMYLLRHVGRDQRTAILDRPHLAAEIVDRLRDETCRHVDAVRELGLEGIYFATLAGAGDGGGSEFGLQAKGDIAVLDRARGLTRFLHLHGAGSSAARLAVYQREVLHRDEAEAGDLAAIRGTGERAVMGGLPGERLTRMSLPAIRQQMADSIAAAGRAGFILAPGCIVSPSLARRTMLAIRNSDLLDNTARVFA